jgi:hypothetical protein
MARHTTSVTEARWAANTVWLFGSLALLSLRPFAYSPFRLLPSLLRDLPDHFRQQVVFGFLDSGV